MTCRVRPAELRTVRVISLARLRDALDLPVRSAKVSSIVREVWETNWRAVVKSPPAPVRVTPKGEASRTCAPAGRSSLKVRRPAVSRVMAEVSWASGDLRVQDWATAAAAVRAWRLGGR